MGKNTVRITYSGDARDLKRASRDAESSLNHVNHAGQRAFGGLSKAAIAGGAVAIAGLYAVGKAGQVAFGELASSEKVGAQTKAVLKSTGGAAHVTAKQVDELAQSLLAKSGVDDEVVKSGENMLLTFRNVRNETGKGNDVFDQATKSLLDMSVATGNDMTKSAIQLGKALNDPIKGMGALRRVGVTFDEQQQKQIKTLVEGGHTMEAQKIILAELNKEFGGSAAAAGKTFTGQWAIAREEAKNAGAELLQGLLPALTGIGRLAAATIPVLTEFGREIASAVGDKAREVVEVVKEHWPQIKATALAVFGEVKAIVVPIFKELASIVRATVENIAGVLSAHREELLSIWHSLSGAFRNLAAVAIPILKILFEEVLPRAIGIAVPVIAKIATVIEGISKVFRAFYSVYLKIIDGFLGGLQAMADGASHLPIVGDKFKGVATAIGRVRDRLHDANREIADFGKKKAVAEVDVNLNYHVRMPAGAHGPVGPRGNPIARGDGVAGAIRRSAPGAARALAPKTPPAGAAGSSPRSDVTPGLWDELALASLFGLGISSTYRPGAITSTGNPSLHGMFPSHAFDASDGTNAGWGSPGMRSYFNSVIGRPGISEVILSPFWWHPGSGLQKIAAPSVMRDHWSHVHTGSRSGDGMVGASTSTRRSGDGKVGPDWIGRRLQVKKILKRQAARRQIDYSQMPAAIAYAISTSHLTADKADDLAALRRYEAYLVKQLRRADLTLPQKTQLTDALVGVRDEIASLLDTGPGPGPGPGADPDLQAQLDQANARLGVARRTADLAEGFVRTGVFGGSAGGGAPQVVFQSLFPPTPEQARQAAAVVAEGAGMQGYRTTSSALLGGV